MLQALQVGPPGGADRGLGLGSAAVLPVQTNSRPHPTTLGEHERSLGEKRPLREDTRREETARTEGEERTLG